MKKTVQEIKNHEVVKYHQKPSSDNEIIGSSNLIRMEKKNTFKTYNEFVRMVINEENKEKMLEEPNNLVLSIAQKEKLDQKEKEKSLNKNSSKLISTFNKKPRSEDEIIQPRKIFTPKANKTLNENLILIEKAKNTKTNEQNFSKKGSFIFTPNITPIKEVLPEKKILVRSYSKGNLVSNSIQAINPKPLLKKSEKIFVTNTVRTFNSNSNHMSIPPKPKNVIEKESEIFEITNNNIRNWNLTEDEKSIYGDRIIENYDKLDLLGKGGFALVWLGADKLNNDRNVAMKQIAKINSENCKKELYFGHIFFDDKGKAREEFSNYIGINYITKFLYHKQTSKDLWMVFELGGQTLSKVLYEMKGEFFKGERVYQIKYSKLYKRFHSDMHLLQKFIRSIAETLLLLSDYKIVHSDLKPDNLLIELNKTSDDFEKLKLIDFGSSYSYDEAGSISMATPEYMPPEVLELLLNSSKYTGPHKSQIEALMEVSKPWSVDVWSLASIILEILIGIPHWISYKCKVTNKKGKEVLKTGLFAVKGRTYDKIIAKQKSLIENLEGKLEDCLDIKDSLSQKLCDLLLKMFEWNPKKRISPEEILKHSFLSQNI